jgi:hypothetical protein
VTGVRGVREDSDVDLNLATISDIVTELRERKTRFVLVAVEPSNNKSTANVIHAAQGINPNDLLGLVKLAWLEAQNERDGGSGPPPSMN